MKLGLAPSTYTIFTPKGPSELSIADPKAVEVIYGSKSPTTKGPWYTLLEPRTPVFMVRDKREHARRRKTWDLAFTTKGTCQVRPNSHKH